MSNHIIGKENLPNVYIDSIIVENNSISMDGCLYDFVDSDKSRWFANHHMGDMKVLIVSTDDQDIINLINLSGSSLLDFDRNIFVTHDIVNPSSFAEGQVRNGIAKYTHNHEFDYDSPIVTLNVYSCAMVEIDFFNNPQLDKYCGPVIGEKIFENQSIPTESGYFYYPDTNEEYGGPVHYHNEEFMETSMHSSAPHRVVRYVPETNSKITDGRT